MPIFTLTCIKLVTLPYNLDENEEKIFCVYVHHGLLV